MKTRFLALLLGLTAIGCSENPTAPARPQPKRPGLDLASTTIQPKLIAGNYHNCVLKGNGSFVCWGDGQNGQLTPPADLGPVKQLALGSAHTCALKLDATVACWGYDGYGEADVPAGLASVVQVSAGGLHSCALTSDGTVTCWGYNMPYWGPPAGLSDVVKIVDGSYNTCATKSDGSTVCFGDNYYGESTIPSSVGNPIEISPGHTSTCALKSDHTVACWGDDYYGQTDVPSGLTDVQHIGSWFYGGCALKGDKTITCWGNNYGGQPVAPPTDLGPVDYLAVGGYHACAVLTDRSIKCWGDNSHGQTTIPAGASFDSDDTPPVITYTRTPPNALGWNNTDVQVSFAVADAESGIASSSGCDPTTLTQEGAAIPVVCSATNGAGLANSVQIAVNIDKTAPTLSAPGNITVDATGPTGANVSYNVGATDLLSGVQSIDCTVPSGSLFPIGTTSVFCTATDRAGNPAVASFDVMVRSAAQQTQNLIDQVSSDPNLKSSLANTLNKALSNPATACKNLDKFIDTVRKSSGKQIPADQAAQLIQSAMNTKATMGCP